MRRGSCRDSEGGNSEWRVANRAEKGTPIRYSLLATRSKSEIDAATHQIVVEADVVGRRAAAVHIAVEAAEIDVEIFELGAPVAGERVLDAAAGGPADLRVGLTREAGRARVDVADRETAGHVRQEVAERVADAAA